MFNKLSSNLRLLADFPLYHTEITFYVPEMCKKSHFRNEICANIVKEFK